MLSAYALQALALKAAEVVGDATVKHVANEFIDQFQIIRDRNEAISIEQLRHDERAFAGPIIVAQFLNAYYEMPAGSSNLSPVSVTTDGHLTLTSVFSNKLLLNLNSSIANCHFNIVRPPNDYINSAKAKSIIKGYVPGSLARIDKMGIEVFDAPIYRLHSLPDPDSLTFQFELKRYFDWRFTSCLLQEELATALIRHKGKWPLLLLRKSLELPLRQCLLPNGGSLCNPQNVISAGGPSVIVAMARGEPHNDFCIPIQIRSGKVNHGHNLLAALPQAFHQHGVDENDEASIQWTAFREIYEELFNGKAAQKDAPALVHDWYFDKCNGVQYFKSNPKNFRMEILSFGINASVGSYEVATLVCITDPSYWHNFQRDMEFSWETKTVIKVSTKNPGQIRELLIDKRHEWTSENIVAFSKALTRLKEIDCGRVIIPELSINV